MNLDYDDLVARLRRFRKRPTYEPIIIKEELTRGELAFVDSHQRSRDFPEMELIHAQKRLYPRDGLAAHVIGYVGEVSENELNTAEFIEYEQGDVVGKQGIERQYNKILMGIDGQRQDVVDNRGRIREKLGLKEAVPGKTLQLTLDLDVQAVAELAMEGVAAPWSRLTHAQGKFSRWSAGRLMIRIALPAAFWPETGARSSSNPEKPMLNRAIQSRLAPGSTFKPIMAIAGLETGVIN